MTDINIEYDPRSQFIPFHQRTQRWGCLVVHRRGGKTVACVNDLGARAIYTPKKDARYAYLAPFYRQAKDVAWVYLKSFLKPIIKSIRESELRVELINGSWITLYGADNPDALRGIYLDGVILDEFGDCRPSLWGQVILPTLVDRKGWAVFIGTPKGKNHFYHIYKRSQTEEGWFNITLKASDSNIIEAEELSEMKAQMSDEEYDQEMECSFDAAVRGTYYTDLINNIEAKGQLDPDLRWDVKQPVNVATDLGYTDSTAIWFWQPRPGGIAIIDYEEAHGKALPHYFHLLRSKPYAYGEVWLPHDAKAKSLQTGMSTVEQFLEEFKDDIGISIRVSPKLDVQDGINAVRKVLLQCWFNSVECYEGIEALRAYRRSYDEVNNVYQNRPVHDWASNGSDAFRYLALVVKVSLGHTETKENRIIMPSKNYPVDLDTMFSENETTGHNILRI
jgi:phage terminase large subunit